MGMTFGNISFKKNNLTKNEIEKKLNPLFEKNGGVGAFAVNYIEIKPWVTVYCSYFDDGSIDSFSFSKKIYRIFRTPMLTFQCYDSDFFIIGITVNNDIDVGSVGIPYNIKSDSDKPIPFKQYWSALLPNDEDFNKLIEITNKDFTCAEDSLFPLSELFGFDPDDINKDFNLKLSD